MAGGLGKVLEARLSEPAGACLPDAREWARGWASGPEGVCSAFARTQRTSYLHQERGALLGPSKCGEQSPAGHRPLQSSDSPPTLEAAGLSGWWGAWPCMCAGGCLFLRGLVPGPLRATPRMGESSPSGRRPQLRSRPEGMESGWGNRGPSEQQKGGCG